MSSNFYEVPENEWSLWFLDQKINAFGVLIDTTLVANAIACALRNVTKQKEEAVVLTGIKNPNSTAQLKCWINRRLGKTVESLDKASVTELLDSDIPSDVRQLLCIRRELARSSVKKYNAMAVVACKDNRIKGSLQFYGANRTGRWAGRQVQLHNLVRNKLKDLDLARELLKARQFDEIEMLFGSVSDTLAQLVRTAFIAGEGKRLIVADFSAIEARVIAWFANEKWRMDVFESHGKIYEASAAQMFGVPIESVTKDSSYRQKGKVAELALGYQGSAGALIRMGALDMGLTESELPDLVSDWRNANRQIVQFWYNVEKAAMQAIREQKEVRLERNLKFKYTKGILFIQLPSGRKLSFLNARIEKGGKFNRERILYQGVHGETKQWETLETYGGRLVENIVQATARDCLAFALTNIDKAGYEIVLHVHDEVVVETSFGMGTKEAISEIMALRPTWARDLSLCADAYETGYYKKD